MHLRSSTLALTLIVAICTLLFLSLKHGPIETSFADVGAKLFVDDGSDAAFALWEIRLPRALNALFVGIGVALSGTLIQVIIRNPLGDPGLTGVSAGAATGVSLIITFWSHAGWAVVTGGIGGGLAAATITFLLAGSSGMRDISVILAGIAVSLFFVAVTSAVMILNQASMQTLYHWMVGGFANKGWLEFSYLWSWIVIGAVLALVMAPVLDVLVMQDEVATGLGVNSGRWRLAGGLLSVVLASVSVAVAGPIGFIGFLSPHLVRVAVSGSGGRLSLLWLMPLAALVGGALVLSADFAARTLPIGNRAPAGVLLTVLGGIGFLILYRKLPARQP